MLWRPVSYRRKSPVEGTTALLFGFTKPIRAEMFVVLPSAAIQTESYPAPVLRLSITGTVLAFGSNSTPVPTGPVPLLSATTPMFGAVPLAAAAAAPLGDPIFAVVHPSCPMLPDALGPEKNSSSHCSVVVSQADNALSASQM